MRSILSFFEPGDGHFHSLGSRIPDAEDVRAVGVIAAEVLLHGAIAGPDFRAEGGAPFLHDADDDPIAFAELEVSPGSRMSLPRSLPKARATPWPTTISMTSGRRELAHAAVLGHRLIEL